MTLAAGFKEFLTAQLASKPAKKLGVAVSGGSDSTALLHLLADWSSQSDCTIHAVTVDHGVRPESAMEAEMVARQCQALGISHDILNWTNRKEVGNFQDQARQARYRLIGDWASVREIGTVALGHTQDDQAETVLMRLLRGSGVDGLSAIPLRRCVGDVCWIRPVLDVARETLREYLRAKAIGWSDDPSNLDPKYDRVKARNLIRDFQSLGFSTGDFAATAGRMSEARQVLQQVTQGALKAISKVEAGSVVVERKGLFDLPNETRRRVLAHILRWISTSHYGPRHSSLVALLSAINENTTSTLHGCLVTIKKDQVIFGREPAAVVEMVVKPSEIWDGRWRLKGPGMAGITIRATGDKGLKLYPNWRDTGLIRATVVSAPAVWKSQQLVAAPVAGLSNGWRAELIHPENHLFTSVLSH